MPPKRPNQGRAQGAKTLRGAPEGRASLRRVERAEARDARGTWVVLAAADEQGRSRALSCLCLLCRRATRAVLGWFSPPQTSRAVLSCCRVFVFALAGCRRPVSRRLLLRSPLRTERASGALASRRGTRAARDARGARRARCVGGSHRRRRAGPFSRPVVSCRFSRPDHRPSSPSSRAVSSVAAPQRSAPFASRTAKRVLWCGRPGLGVWVAGR